MVQEGEVPHEDPQELIQETFRLIQEQEQLFCQINRANLEVKLPDGRSLMEAIAARDRLTLQCAVLKQALQSSMHNPDLYSQREIKWKSVLKVAGLQKQADDLSKKLRELNTLIQATNWTAEIPTV